PRSAATPPNGSCPTGWHSDATRVLVTGRRPAVRRRSARRPSTGVSALARLLLTAARCRAACAPRPRAVRQGRLAEPQLRTRAAWRAPAAHRAGAPFHGATDRFGACRRRPLARQTLASHRRLILPGAVLEHVR